MATLWNNLILLLIESKAFSLTNGVGRPLCRSFVVGVDGSAAAAHMIIVFGGFFSWYSILFA
jgi:hypothetical protein